MAGIAGKGKIRKGGVLSAKMIGIMRTDINDLTAEKCRFKKG